MGRAVGACTWEVGWWPSLLLSIPFLLPCGAAHGRCNSFVATLGSSTAPSPSAKALPRSLFPQPPTRQLPRQVPQVVRHARSAAQGGAAPRLNKLLRLRGGGMNHRSAK